MNLRKPEDFSLATRQHETHLCQPKNKFLNGSHSFATSDMMIKANVGPCYPEMPPE